MQILSIFSLVSGLLLAGPQPVSIGEIANSADTLYENIVLQPQFCWADGSCTYPGTASFVRGPKGKVIALTSAHFLNFSGPQLSHVNFLSVNTKKPVATSTRCWGQPGQEGCYQPVDLRSDYLLLVVEGKIPSQKVLQLSGRSGCAEGEKVWFPNKNPLSPHGHDRIEGTVAEAQNTFLKVILDREIDLNARSGTPVLSEKTGKVIGILTGGETRGNRSVLYLAPASSIHKALKAHEYPLLRDVVGK